MPDISIFIPGAVWEATGSDSDERTRLLTTIIINGCHMHLEAYEVHKDEHGIVMFKDPSFKLEDSALYDFVQGAPTTVQIQGRTYALVATPFQAYATPFQA